ncbi:chymotrypsinogen B [Folsomia candida]|uniref:Chymotrypsinogen B n=1 Tax=Folsomia candida TaxID=158441 RepID=A0A226D9N9_FOLCA|nr:chymotrypsinogen B [Folsomia candida]OXA41929.1 Chymotrypsinogen B [Folsomia candida]
MQSKIILFIFSLTTVDICRGSILFRTETENSSGKIVGGTDAKPHEFPYQISLQDRGWHICGGTILSDVKIATAAHCCEDYLTTWSDLRVVAGAHVAANSSEPNQQRRSVNRPRIYDGYDQYYKTNDACILTVTEPLELNPAVKAMPLCEVEPAPGTVCTATGWGRTNPDGIRWKGPLQKLNMTIVSRPVCERSYGPLEEDVICAGGVFGKDICFGDSGGPLVCGTGSSKCLAGVASYVSGMGCAQGIPSGFTNVAWFYKFFTNDG